MKKDTRTHRLLAAVSAARSKEQAEARTSSDKHLVEFSDFASVLTGRSFATETDIVEAANAGYRFLCGVYFLVKDERVVYVGQSTNIAARISQHVGVKDFDGYAFIQCDADNLDMLESLYIHVLNPPLNGGVVYGKKTNAAPLSWEAIVSAYKGSCAGSRRLVA